MITEHKKIYSPSGEIKDYTLEIKFSEKGEILDRVIQYVVGANDIKNSSEDLDACFRITSRLEKAVSLLNEELAEYRYLRNKIFKTHPTKVKDIKTDTFNILHQRVEYSMVKYILPVEDFIDKLELVEYHEHESTLAFYIGNRIGGNHVLDKTLKIDCPEECKTLARTANYFSEVRDRFPTLESEEKYHTYKNELIEFFKKYYIRNK